MHWAIKKGILIKPDKCQSNGRFEGPCSSGPLQAHHHKGYARENRLEVEFLCPKHHREADRIQALENKKNSA